VFPSRSGSAKTRLSPLTRGSFVAVVVAQATNVIAANAARNLEKSVMVLPCGDQLQCGQRIEGIYVGLYVKVKTVKAWARDIRSDIRTAASVPPSALPLSGKPTKG
jgi:hypothetical protein